MGLDISHDAFHGAYSAFNGFRQKIAKAIGGSYPPHTNKETFPDDNLWYVPDSYSEETHPSLWLFLNHSDCDGEISWLDAAGVANALEQLLPDITKLEDGTHNHIQREGGYAAVIKKFINGCRLAFRLKEPLTFG